MKKSIVNVLICLIFIVSMPVLGDEINTARLKNWQLENYANEAIRINDFYIARDCLVELMKRKPDRIKYQVKLALLYEKNRDYEKALHLFRQIDELDSDKFASASFHLGKMYKVFGEYEQAIEVFTRLRRKRKSINLGGISKNRIQNELAGCDLAISFQDTMVRTRIRHLNNTINKPYIEFGPILLADTMFAYGSSQPDGVGFLDMKNGYKATRQFEMAVWKGEKWIGGRQAPPPFLNFEDYDTGRGVFSLDGNRFYFTKCARNLKNKMICHLWFTQNVNDLWQSPLKLNRSINHPRFSTAHPTIGTCYDKNLEVIYFVSDRPGGMGGEDIWYILYDRANNKHAAPENAGVYINTKEDEVTPFYDLEAHQLYFSSNGWVSIGGFDLFKSQGDMVNWELPVNIGLPINSTYDDLDFVKNESGSYGLFASNRPGSYYVDHPSCCDDLYVFEETNTDRILVTGRLLKENLVQEGKYYTENDQSNTVSDSMEVLNEKVIAIRQLKKDSTTVFLKELKTNVLGEFALWVEPDLEYELVVQDSSLMDRKISFSTQNEVGISQIDLSNISLKSIPIDAIVVENVYYEVDQTELSVSAQNAIDTTLLVLAQKYPHIIIEVRSHTDNVGHDRYNKRLSEKRAKNVVDYLIQKGISANRLKSKGYGETNPIAPNLDEHGNDNPAGRQKNRRTEFKIIGVLNND